MAITKAKYVGTDGKFGPITREEIIRNSKKISKTTFKRIVSNESWREVSGTLWYEVNKRSGMTMGQDEYIEYYRSYFVNAQFKLRVYVFFLKHSSTNYYFK